MKQPNETSRSWDSGALLRDKYRIVRLLGEGGMGRVYEAVHVDLDRRVAIKLLHDELRANAELRERFVREGRAASKIDSEHVAAVLDVDRIEDGTPFIVMEFLEGRDLSFVRRNRAPLPIAIAADYVLQACTALGQAHARGVIHRDIKPANLFLARREDGTERLKILDFGISKLADGVGASQPSMTRTMTVMGSVEYMSPEQMLSMRDVDARADLWSLAVVLYELLTANVPFTGETSTQVCAQVMSRPPIPATHFRPDLPAPLEQLILRSLDKNREHRCATAWDFAEALRTVLAQIDADDSAAMQEPTVLVSRRPPTPIAPRTQLLADATDAAVRESALGPAFESSTRVSAAPLHAPPLTTTSVAVSSGPIPSPPRNGARGLAIALGGSFAAVAVVGALWLGTLGAAPSAAAGASAYTGAASSSRPEVQRSTTEAAPSAASGPSARAPEVRVVVVSEPSASSSPALKPPRAATRPPSPPPTSGSKNGTPRTGPDRAASATPKRPSGID